MGNMLGLGKSVQSPLYLADGSISPRRSKTFLDTKINITYVQHSSDGHGRNSDPQEAIICFDHGAVGMFSGI